MNIAIVEDESAHGRLLRQYVENWGTARGVAVHCFLYENAESFLFQREDLRLDALFADIQMPGMDGMEMVRRLREQDAELPIVFTTGITDYLQEGYEVQALHYLLKPISEEKVAECLDRIGQQRGTGETFVIRTEEGNARVCLREVNYCEAQGHYTLVCLCDKSRLLALSSITDLEKELTGRHFVKCHRSYLCNLENVKQIRQEAILFDNGEEIPVSRRLYREMNRQFIAFYRRGEEA